MWSLYYYFNSESILFFEWFIFDVHPSRTILRIGNELFWLLIGFNFKSHRFWYSNHNLFWGSFTFKHFQLQFKFSFRLELLIPNFFSHQVSSVSTLVYSLYLFCLQLNFSSKSHGLVNFWVSTVFRPSILTPLLSSNRW